MWARLGAMVGLLGAGALGCVEAGGAGATAEDDGAVAVAGEPAAVRLVDVATGGATAEEAAGRFLAGPARALGLGDGALVPLATRRGRAGSYVRFQRTLAGLPVFDAQVVVAVSADHRRVRAVNRGRLHRLAAPRIGIDRGPAVAIAIARAHVGAPLERVPPAVVRGLAVAGGADRLRLAYRVTLAAVAPAASWQITVDAADGAILAARDRNARADGSGLVFDVTPVASTGDPTLADGGDAPTPALTAARFAVTLPRLDGSGVLRGAWADVRNPAARASSPALAFAYDRDDDRFEEVMAYYHLDRAQARLQALGFTDVLARPQVAIVNALTEDASFFDPLALTIRYGSGGVDDGEDADILLHEYGHAIQADQVVEWGGGDEGAIGEGFGDYLAASFGEVLPAAAGRPQPFGQFACVGEWDATAYATTTPKCLRRVDGDGHAPERTTGRIHADGQIWSAALWRARAALGADVVDRIVVESHFLLTNDETFASAAQALVAAEDMLYAGAHAETLRRALYHHGLLRVPRPRATYTDVVASEAVTLANPTGADGNYPPELDDTRTYTRPGSLALRVHFATLDLAGNGTCDDPDCDNLYLSDGDGDLYQIFTRLDDGPRTSVQVPGDTVSLRLITDRAGQRPGYVVDRVEAMGGVEAIDARVDGRPRDGATATDADRDVDAAGVDARDPAADGEGGGCCQAGRAPGSAIAPGLLVVGLGGRRRRRPRR